MAFSKCTGVQKNNLPFCVSEWKQYHLEYLHIYYAKDFAETPLSIFQRITTLTELDEEQKKYIEDLKSYLEFDASVRKLKFQSSVVHSIISRLHSKLKRQPDSVTTLKDAFVITQVKRFVVALDRLVADVQDNFKNLNTYEGVYSRFVSAFAELCCLESIQCSNGEETTWSNFRGLTLISEPEYLFFKLGLPQKRTNTLVSFMSVSEVNNNIKSKHKQRLEREHICSRRKRSNSSTSDTSDSSSSDTDSACYKRCQRQTLRKHEEDKTSAPLIEDIMNNKVLGQHGGELLLHLNKFYGDSEAFILTIPGMIVKETTVVFTLLEMSQKHLEKLRNNTKLEKSDEATIYYSQPYDILYQESRDVLIENFMRLNNINKDG